MKKHVIRISTLFIAMMMVLGPVPRAVFAADDGAESATPAAVEMTEPAEESAPAEVPDTPDAPDAPETVETSAITAETPADAAAAVPVAADSASAATESTPAAVTEEDGGSAAKSGEPAVTAAEDDASTDKLYSVGGTVFYSTTDQSSSWSGGSGWKYDAASETITMVNYNGADQSILSDGTGVTIQAAGLNRISTLSCDGTVNLIGTGILLVDEIELADGSDFNLLPNKEVYGENGGSVAVFLKQSDGSYSLINRDIAGVLDESYYVPDGITLEIPADSTLCIQSLFTLVKYDSDTETETVSYVTEEHSPTESDAYFESDTNYDDSVTSGHLNAESVRVNKGGTIHLQNASGAINHVTITAESVLTVRKALDNNGVIEGGAVALGGAADLSGSGSFSDTDLTINKGQKTSVTMTDSTLRLNGSGTEIETLTVSGDVCLVYGSDVTIDGIVFKNASDELRVQSKSKYESSATLTFRKPVTAGTVTLQSGVYNVPAGSKAIRTKSDHSWVGKTGIHVVYTREKPTEDQPPVSAIPVSIVSIVETETYNEGFINEYDSAVDGVPVETDLEPYPGEDGEDLTFDTLFEKYVSDHKRSKIVFELTVLGEDGNLEPVFLTNDGNTSVVAETVYRIRILDVDYLDNVLGGGTSTTTNTSFTGTGVLGANAGSISGGNKTRVLSGAGINRAAIESPKPDPDPDPEPDPKPDPDPTPDPDPEPDPKPDPEPDPKPDPEPKPDPDPTPDPDPVRPDDNTNRRTTAATLVPEVRVDFVEETEETGAYYVLSVVIGNTVLETLEGYDIVVEMAFDLPEEWKDKPVYAVFRTTLPEGDITVTEDDLAENADADITVIPAAYDEETGLLAFEAVEIGPFVIICFDYDGEVNTPEFFEAVKQLDDVQALLALEEAQD